MGICPLQIELEDILEQQNLFKYDVKLVRLKMSRFWSRRRRKISCPECTGSGKF